MVEKMHESFNFRENHVIQIFDGAPFDFDTKNSKFKMVNSVWPI